MANVGQSTYGAVIVQAADLMGALLYRGILTAATTTTATDANSTRLPTAESGAMTGRWLYIYAGTQAGATREITTYTLGVMTWIQALSGAPDTTSLYAIMAVDPRILQEGLESVQRLAAFRMAVPYDSYSLMTNNLLHFMGDFEEWTGGTTSAPDGTVLAGAGSSIAREATTRIHGLYSAAVTAGAGAVATLTYTVDPELLRYLGGASLYLYGLMAETTAADAILRVTHTTGAGVATSGNWAGTYTGSRFEELESITPTTLTNPFTLPAITGALTVQARTALSATCQFDDLFLGGPPLYDYDVPTSLIKISPIIYMERERASRSAGGLRSPETYPYPLRYRTDWTTSPKPGSTRRRIRFFNALPTGYHLHIKGLQIPTVVASTSPTTNLNINSDYAAYATGAYAKRVLGLGAGAFFNRRYIPEILRQESEALENQFATDTNDSWVDIERAGVGVGPA